MVSFITVLVFQIRANAHPGEVKNISVCSKILPRRALLNNLALLAILQNDFLEFHRKGKFWAYLMFWNKCYFSVKLIYYLVSYYETKANALSVHILLVLNESKKLKELVLIFFLDTYSSIFHRNDQSRLINFYNNLHITFFCKFDCVGNEAQ